MSGLLNKWNLKVAAFASREGSRYTLQAIQVTPDATIATDGHVLGWVSTPKMDVENFPIVPNAPKLAGAASESFLMSLETAAAVEKALPRKTTIPILENAAIGEPDAEGNRALVTTDLENGRVISSRKVAGTFPNYLAVMPMHAEDDKPGPSAHSSKKPTFRIAVSAKLLTRVAKALADFKGGRDGQDPVYLSFYDADSAVRIDATRDDTSQGMTVVLMPMRGADTDAAHCYGWDVREAARQAERDAARLAEAQRDAVAEAAKGLTHGSADKATIGVAPDAAGSGTEA